MKKKILTVSFLILAFGQTACLTTVHTRPYHQDDQRDYRRGHHHGHHHGRTVHVSRPRPVYVPVHRPAKTTVTVRRY
jgi:hypothetical protein